MNENALKQRNPGSRPGFQTEPSVNNSDWAPHGNLLKSIGELTSAVKRSYSQTIVGEFKQNPTGCGKKDSSITDQQELLNQVPARDHHLGLLLALHGDLRPEHCEQKTTNDDWSSELSRRVNKFA